MMNDDPVMNVDDLLLSDEYFGPSAPSIAGKSPPLGGRPSWGPWATIGWTLLCLVVMAVVQLVIFVVFIVVEGATTPRQIQALSSSSLLLSVATLTSTPVIIGLVVLLIYLRGCPIRDYLAWRLPGVKRTILAVAGLAILLIASDTLTYLLGRPIVSEVMIEIYQTGWVVPLMITMIVAAPLGEETLFRGFFYQGVASSRWGSLAAILLSSLAWASIHVQYDLYAIGLIAVMGLYLGEVRRRTDSLPLTIILHGIANIVATIEMMIVVSRRGG